MVLKKADVEKLVVEKLNTLVADGIVDLMNTETLVEVYERVLAGIALKTTPTAEETTTKGKLEVQIVNARESLKTKNDYISTMKSKITSLEIKEDDVIKS